MAACVQRINYVKSYYMREGELKNEEEKILLIKCLKDNKEKIEHFFSKNHPYETPEMIWLHPEHVNDAYKEWMKSLASNDNPAKKKKDK